MFSSKRDFNKVTDINSLIHHWNQLNLAQDNRHFRTFGTVKKGIDNSSDEVTLFNVIKKLNLMPPSFVLNALLLKLYQLNRRDLAQKVYLLLICKQIATDYTHKIWNANQAVVTAQAASLENNDYAYLKNLSIFVSQKANQNPRYSLWSAKIKEGSLHASLDALDLSHTRYKS